MKFEDIYLSSLGTFVPGLVTTEQAVESGWYDAEVREASGLESVAIADGLSAPEMAVLAATEALSRTDHAAEDFVALFHASAYHQGPDGWSPPHYVLNNTLQTPITALEVKHNCQGMLSALVFSAHRLASDARSSAVLVTAADNYCVPLVDRWTTASVSVFGDGAAAAVVSREGGIAKLLSVGTYSAPSMESLHRGSEPIFPPAVTVGRTMNFDERVKFWMEEWAKGNTPPMEHPGDVLQKALDEALEDAGVKADEIKRVCHPSATLDALRDQFLDPIGFSLDRGIWEHTRRVGHIGAADVFIGLEHLWSTRQVGPGDKVMLFTGGPGFEAGVAILEIVSEPAA